MKRLRAALDAETKSSLDLKTAHGREMAESKERLRLAQSETEGAKRELALAQADAAAQHASACQQLTALEAEIQQLR